MAVLLLQQENLFYSTVDIVCGFVPALVAETLLLVAPSINRDAARLVSKSGHRDRRKS